MIQGENEVFTLERFEGSAEEVSEQWRATRKKGIGGSDVAAIMGLSAFSSAYSVWAEKTGQTEPEDISGKPAVHWGNVLEPVIGREYKRNHPGREVRRVNAIVRNIARPWAQASLDYEVKDEELGWGVLEIKTAGLMRAKDWEEGVPVYYQTQVVHYLTVTGRKFADVAILIGGQDYREYRIMRDDEDAAAVTQAVDDFWHIYVEGGEEPPITGTAADAEAVFSVHGDGSEEIREELEDPEPLKAFIAASSAKKMAEDMYKKAANELKAYIGDDKGIKAPSGKVLWLKSTRKRFDAKAFDRDHPGARDAYIQEKPNDGGLRFTAAKED